MDIKYFKEKFFDIKNRIIRLNVKNITNEEITFLKEYFKNEYNSIDESLYRIKNDIIELPKCPICGKPLKFRNTALGYYKACKEKCKGELSKLNSRKTKLERYGNQFYNNHEQMKQTKLERYGDPNYTNLEKTKQTKLERYGDPNYTNLEKTKQTIINKYGVENPYQIKSVIEKIQNKRKKQIKQISEKCKQTWLNKYGVDHPVKNDKIKNKIKETCFKKYGVYYGWNNETQKETMLKLYGAPHNFSSKIIRDKIKQTCLKKYGAESWAQSEIGKNTIKKNINNPIIRNKIYLTKKENHSFNTSKPEEESYNLLLNKYKIVLRQYKTDKYPFSCDFYIPDEDLYIECNYHWTHGGHIFNPNSEEDINTLKLWESKNTDFFKNAINTWTKRDINKINILKKNNLNYKIFWNINELKKWIKDYE